MSGRESNCHELLLKEIWGSGHQKIDFGTLNVFQVSKGVRNSNAFPESVVDTFFDIGPNIQIRITALIQFTIIREINKDNLHICHAAAF